MRRNWPTLVMLGIAGLIFGLVGVPWTLEFGHWWISLVFYGVLLLAALYCRCNQEPIHSKLFHRKVRRTPQSL